MSPEPNYKGPYSGVEGFGCLGCRAHLGVLGASFRFFGYSNPQKKATRVIFTIVNYLNNVL